MNLQVLPVFVDDLFRPEGALRQTLRMIEAAHRIAEASPETRLCLDGSGEDATGSRLTRAGVAAHAEMERLGMIFDVSHLSVAGVDHVLELSSRPVMAIDRLVDHIEHIAGVMGVRHVGLAPDFVKEVLADVTPPCCEARLIEGVPTDRFLPGLEGSAGCRW